MAKRGRPRTKPVPEPSPSRTIKVYARKPGSEEEVILYATHRHVPGDWSHEGILRRFGIGRHLKVVAETRDAKFVVQDFPSSTSR